MLETAFTLLIVSGLGVGGLASMLSVVQLLQLPELLKVSFAFTLHEYAPVESAEGVQFVAVGVPVCVAVPLQSVVEYNSTRYPATAEHPISEGAVQERVGAVVAVHVPPEGESPMGVLGPAKSVE